MDKLLQNIKDKIKIATELENAIEAAFTYEAIAKNTLLLREGQYCRKLYFLSKGTVRTYYFHKDKDTTSWFYRENQFLSSWYSFYTQEASYENIEAVEDCEVYWITYDNYQKLFIDYPKFERFGRLLAEEQSAFIDAFSKGYMFMSAKERYDSLLAVFPDISLRVNLGHIASFLGISQETLSRIRSKKS